MTAMTAFALVGVAGAAAAAGNLGARAAARSGPMHEPSARQSSHKTVTPSGGGLGVLAGVAAGLIVLGAVRPAGLDAEGVRRLAALMLVALTVAAIGLFDDLFDWSARLKLGLLGAASVAIAVAAGAPEELPVAGALGLPLATPIGLFGAALWAFTAKNAVNFMDGANGLVGGAVGLASAALAALAAVLGADVAAFAAAALAGALMGFLPVNAPAARVFLGDVGSLFVGAWYAGAALLFVHEAPRGAVYLPPLLVLPILADVLLTMAWHVRRRISITTPHLDHAYQLRLKRGESHAEVVRGVWRHAGLLAALGVLAGLGLAATGEPFAPLAALGLGVAASWRWWRADRARAGAAAPPSSGQDGPSAPS